jgi:hypothetical protein
VEEVKSALDFKFENHKKEEIEALGKIRWEISEYEKLKIIKIYEPDRLIAVIADRTKYPGDVADSVIGYLYESEEEETPVSLF